MPKEILILNDYQKLVRELKSEIARGIREIERLIERQKVLTYWELGRKIHLYLNSHEQERGAITEFYIRLSKDLKMCDRTLQQCEQFFRYFPDLKVEEKLNWSHYRYLLGVPDEKARRAWIRRAQKNGWPADELHLFLLDENGKSAFDPLTDKLDEPLRGKLYTYKLIRAQEKEMGVEWFVDCGFANRVKAPASNAKLHNKRLYTSVKENDLYRLNVCGSKVHELYTFQASLIRVIDADTLVVLVDQGFSVFTEQKLRLRGLDAPELTTLAGKKAKRWVEKRLSVLAFIIIKTYKSDKYDRYLVDVFYKSGEADPAKVASEGIWLNGEMLKSGVAQRWSA